jgi:hypothetical protein
VMAALDPRHPGERQLMRMERQLVVLDRNLLAMQRAHLFPVNARQQLARQEVGVR